MTEVFNEAEAVAAVAGLSPARLQAFVEAGLVGSLPSRGVYRPADLARLALLCDLAEHLDLQTEALSMVMGLIDQLHDARLRLFAMAEAMDAEPQDLRRRVGERFLGIITVR